MPAPLLDDDVEEPPLLLVDPPELESLFVVDSSLEHAARSAQTKTARRMLRA